MKKSLIVGLILSLSTVNYLFAGDPEFNCVSFTTSCGVQGVACGFSEEERVQDVVTWQVFHCGDASVSPAP
ncbi:hypothetical protein [Rhodonellum sp.]|uniref:hypothetical protein n=1 Tax=Rhodonellum sp. TaxID=2231180 RepID=UPI002723E6B1|nr:hypothetical protein [Rhodonellum sp.]MDO9554277.1 hypothetical protein [Rhodonellum sp.]